MIKKHGELSPEEMAKRTHKHAVNCAKHFQKIGKKLIKKRTPDIDFSKKSIEEINQWIAEVTSALGIRQFNK